MARKMLGMIRSLITHKAMQTRLSGLKNATGERSCCAGFTQFGGVFGFRSVFNTTLSNANKVVWSQDIMAERRCAN